MQKYKKITDKIQKIGLLMTSPEDCKPKSNIIRVKQLCHFILRPSQAYVMLNRQFFFNFGPATDAFLCFGKNTNMVN